MTRPNPAARLTCARTNLSARSPIQQQHHTLSSSQRSNHQAAYAYSAGPDDLVVLLLSSAWAFSAPVLAASTTWSLVSMALCFTFSAAFWTFGGGVAETPTIPTISAITVTSKAPMPPATSGRALTASTGSFLAMAQKRSTFSRM